MSKEIYDKKDIYDELNKQVYFRDGGSVNLASLASSVEKIRSNSKIGGGSSGNDNYTQKVYRSALNNVENPQDGDICIVPGTKVEIPLTEDSSYYTISTDKILIEKIAEPEGTVANLSVTNMAAMKSFSVNLTTDSFPVILETQSGEVNIQKQSSSGLSPIPYIKVYQYIPDVAYEYLNGSWIATEQIKRILDSDDPFQKGMSGQIIRDASSGYLAVDKKPTTLGDKILIDPFIFPLGDSSDYNLAVVGNYSMHDQVIEGIECNICLRIRGNNGEHVLPKNKTLYIHPMGSSDNPERAYEIAATSSEEIVVRYHGGDEIYRFTINDTQLYSDGIYIPLTEAFLNGGYQYNCLISEEISKSRELVRQWDRILTVDLAIPQTIAEAEMNEYGSLIWKAAPTLSDDVSRDIAGENYIPTNKAIVEYVKENSVPMILTCFYDDNLSAHYFYTPAIIYRYTTEGSGEFTVKLSTGQSATWQFIGIYSRNHSLDNSGEVLSYCQFTVPETEGYLDTVTGQSANFEIATKHVTGEKTTMFYLCALDNNEIPIAVLPIIVTALPDNDQ